MRPEAYCWELRPRTRFPKWSLAVLQILNVLSIPFGKASSPPPMELPGDGGTLPRWELLEGRGYALEEEIRTLPRPSQRLGGELPPTPRAPTMMYPAATGPKQ